MNVNRTMVAIAAALIAGAGGGVLATGMSASARAPSHLDPTQVAASLAQRLPRTKISQVDCGKFAGICEVTAGANLFYVDRTARYLILGRVYDMQTRQDLTAARLLQLSPDSLLAGAAKADGPDGESVSDSEIPARVEAAKPVNLARLPKAGAIRWGPATSAKLVVFTDFHCGYCRAMSGELEKLGLQVEERPISILGTRKISEAVYCARDPVKALHGAYAGDVPAGSPKCDTSGLDANERFARDNGFNGTPVIVRPSDGAVLQGYRSPEALVAFAKGGRGA